MNLYSMMDFKKWMMEGGTSRGFGGGLEPQQELPQLHATAMQDFHDKNATNPDSNGMLPPIKKHEKKLNRNNGRRKKA